MTQELTIDPRTYEMFEDESYYGMWCVRDKADRDFNSRTSWHFTHKKDAYDFLMLLTKAKQPTPAY